jgi:hypothetical protein
MGKKKDAHMVLVDKPEGKRPFRRTRRRLEDNIKIDLRKVGWEPIDLTQDRNRWWAVVNAVMTLRERWLHNPFGGPFTSKTEEAEFS